MENYTPYTENRIVNLAVHRLKHGFENRRIVLDEDGFRQMFEKNEFTSDQLKRALSVLRHFLGMLNEMPDELTSGHLSSSSTSGCYNVIPNDQQAGICSDVVICHASSRGNRRRSLRNVLRDLRAHLIDCSHTSEMVFILTDTWDPAQFRESEADLKSHIRKGKQVFAGLIAGERLIPLELPFDN